ncbi:MAG TPA: LamG domain-containing protein [Sedimentisphaerales bacterium]|nr:LamG domain-containing protein [Sedimentisphaerales bacterium]
MSKKLFYLVTFVLVLSLVGSNVVFGAIEIERNIASSNDDGEALVDGGADSRGSSDLEMPWEGDGATGNKQIIGLRFRDIPLEKGEEISEAYVQFTADDQKVSGATVNLIISGLLQPNPGEFGSGEQFYDDRDPKTAAEVKWTDIPDWTLVIATPESRTPNIASIINEIISQNDWTSGNALILFIRDDETNPSTDIRSALADGPAKLILKIAVPYATEPSPANGALLEETWVTLGWAPGKSAVSHDVYMADNLADVESGAESAFQGNQATTMFIAGFAGFAFPDGLVPGTTYYWRVDEVEADGTTVSGEVWSFLVPPKKAYNPNPGDGKKNIDPDVELNWTEGYGAKLHTVYFGDNFDQVNNATGGQSQAALTYTPGTLESGKAYYWRVDEFDVVTTHKGDVWSFTTLPVITITDPNLIGWWMFDEGTGNTAIDFSGYGNNGTLGGGAQWVDGVIGGALNLVDGGHVIIDSVLDDITSPNISLSIWIKTTQGSEGELIAANTTGSSHPFMLGIQGGNIYVNEDSDVGQFPPAVNDDQWHMITYVRNGSRGYIYVDGVEQGRYQGGFDLDAIARWSIGMEWDSAPSNFYNGMVDDARFYNASLTADQVKELMRGDPLVAWKPSPDNNSTVDIDEAKQPLSWSAGDAASEHDVYFGADKDAVEKADASDTTGIYRGRQGATSYSIPEALEWAGGPYYWRIDENNTDGTISTGGTWSFSVADYLIVDDFEDYDTGENQIWYAWVDGLGYGIPGTPPYSAGNGSGSAVGDETTYSYTEETIVHGGSQAMPVYYDNNQQAKLKYSEVEMTLSSLRDWTKEGVGVLTIWFHGVASNGAESLYVALNGNAVVTHDNPNAAQVETWTQWNIDLQAFADQGVNLANVNTIAIGIGNKNNPLAGGSGTMYIDDILLYRPAP